VIVPADQARFWKLVSIPTDPRGCWWWLGSIDAGRYGRFTYRSKGRNRTEGAHRITFVLTGGILPRGHILATLCGNRDCCNPHHWRAISRLALRKLRGIAARLDLADAYLLGGFLQQGGSA
jgi:hypothetical protein